MLGEGLAGELAKGSCISDAAASMAATCELFYSISAADLQLMHVMPIASPCRGPMFVASTVAVVKKA